MTFRRNPDYVDVMNTDLRDGRQAPGYSMRDPENPTSIDWILDHARKLKSARYDILEAGFAVGGEEEQRIISEVGKVCLEGIDDPQVFNPQVAAMSFMLNLKKPDEYRQSLDAAFQSINSLIECNRGRITMLVSTSPLMRKNSTRMSKPEIIENAQASGEYVVREFAKRCGYPNLQYYIEGATQTEPDFLIDVNRAIIQAIFSTAKKEGFKTEELTIVASLPDTTGVARPSHYGKMFAQVHQEIPEIKKYGVITSAHCHNDRGNAVANSVEAVENGARQVEVTTLGIGERCGNASASEVVCQLHEYEDDLDYVEYGVNRSALQDCAESLSRITGHTILPNQPLHGINANATAAGIHQNAQNKDDKTYNAIDVREYGNDADKILLSAMSGLNTVRALLMAKGLKLDEGEYRQLTRELKDQETRSLTIEQFIAKYVAIPERVRGFEFQDFTHGGIKLMDDTFHYAGGDTEQVQFQVTWQNGRDHESELLTSESTTGLIDATKRAYEAFLGQLIEFKSYNITPSSEVSSSAEVVADISMLVDGKFVRGLGVSHDQNRAAARAIANGLNRLPQTRERVSQTPGK